MSTYFKITYMTETHVRIRELRKARGFTQEDVAKRLHISTSAVTQWEKEDGTKPNGENLVQLAKMFKTTPDDIIDSGGVNSPTARYVTLDDEVFATIPFKKIEARATVDGFEVHFEDDEEMEPLFYRKDWIKRKKFRIAALVARTVSGPSMEPALHDGDFILINLDSREPKNGKVFHVIIDGNSCAKRLRKRSNNEWWITSDNKLHEIYDQPLENMSQIIGEVVGKSSENI